MKTLQIHVVEFQRKRNGPIETGVMINNDSILFDMDGRLVPNEPQVYNYWDKYYKGCLIVKAEM